MTAKHREIGMDQHDYVRRHHTCPSCLGAKPEGLILCWPCHHMEKERNDGRYSVVTEARIDSLDAALKQVQQEGNDEHTRSGERA